MPTSIMKSMITVVQEGSVLRVSLNRPEVRNALNDELIEHLIQVFTTVSPAIRVIVLAGKGPAFCAGGDLEWMQKAAGYTEEQNRQDALRIAKLFGAIKNCTAVTIAVVHGAAMGGAGGLISACDIAISTQDAKFGFTEVRLGLIPATISPFVIDRIGPGHARALFVSGEIFDAERAQRIGLVHDVVPAIELERTVQKKIRGILANGPSASLNSRKLVLDHPLSTEETANRLAATRASAEGKEGITAFLEKRNAAFVEVYDPAE
ncbi:MAG TPA: enoyl-CoA hydratase-related protein [Fimbriimonas sp.]|nr:enoyl-CoA hydratase-related protein [Fimbriimonas sp.]